MIKINPINLPAKMPITESLLIVYFLYKEQLTTLWIVIITLLLLFLWVKWIASLNHKRLDIFDSSTGLKTDTAKSWVEQTSKK